MTTIADSIIPRLLAASDDPLTPGESYSGWASPQRARQQAIIDEAGGVSGRGYEFPDGSAVAYLPTGEISPAGVKLREWQATTTAELDRVPDNPAGITRINYTADGFGPTLCDVLDREGVEYARVEIPYIVGMGGSAYWVSYTSPRTGGPVTVLCTPIRYEVDGFAEQYYHLEGVTEAEAHDRDWSEVYDVARALERDQA